MEITYRKNKQFFLLFCLLLLPVVTFASTGSYTDQLGEWTGKHTRLVWVQDVGDGADTFANSDNLMLYGYDSADGKGERPLVPNVGNFFKPLFTPDGNNVIVSNRKGRQMYLVEWASGKVTELGDGVAVAIWDDPVGGVPTTWVYSFVGSQPENKYGTGQPLYRFPLHEPEKKELVWNKTNMAWSNIQLSRDGELLGGLFPWPDGGILHTESLQFQRYGRGCWTSLSPDNSKLLWIFDGLHRNVQIYDTVGGDNWKVNINGAKSMGGFEVYHPRWSNHPNYFVVTGPYKKGDGGNKISGGGDKVEVYVGRLDDKARTVEDWFQVTMNGRGDFYPDMWVDGGGKARLADSDIKMRSGESVKNWPVAPENLVFVWENMKAANQLGEQSPVGFYQCNITLRGRALHTKKFQLTTNGGWGETGEAGKKIGSVLAKSRKMTVEFMLTPLKNQNGTIMSFQSGKKKTLMIEQDGSALLVRSGINNQFVVWQDLLTQTIPLHLILLVDGNSLELFADGRSVGKKMFTVDFSGQNIDGFVIGDRGDEWHGIVDGIAVYNKTLTPAEVGQNSRYGSARIATKPEDPAVIVMAKLLDRTEIPTPDSIGAYRRALVINSYSIDKVVQGNYKQDRILVAEWAVLDRNIVKEYKSVGESERLELEKFDEHPELEGERQMMDVFEPDLDMYYRIDQHSRDWALEKTQEDTLL